MIGGGEETPAAVGSSQPLEWKFAQVFGEQTAGEEVQEGSISNSDFEFIDLIMIYLFKLGLDYLVSFNYNERRRFRGD